MYDKRIQEVIEKARVISREELLEIFENRIKEIKEDKYGHYKYDGYWFLKREREEQERLLKEFDKGKPVEWLTSYDHFGYGTWGEDYITRLYTDGTYTVESHFAD